MQPALDLLHPAALLLLVPALALGWLAARRSAIELPRRRARVVAALRALLLLDLILVLAGARALLRRDEVDVVFCLDRSASIDPARAEWALSWVKDAARGARAG